MTTYRPHPLDQGHPPEWASGWGEDKYGVFVEFTVESVVQRMRWISAGKFDMGSPLDQGIRESDETPHEVSLTKGFWLADTPCTQELWQAVTKQNPSRFVSPTRPVEEVSWDDAQAFLSKLGRQVPGLSPRLPTEAEWEFACRAGTEEATYAGDLEILGRNNAPVLDAIAWYGGNSGVGFDLEEGVATKGDLWREKQYPETKRAGTRIVGQKTPNPWGLYDMLGNVWEWCEDFYGSYPTEPSVDPQGPEKGASRVIRGGSWFNFARYVRAAYRYRVDPSGRNGGLGFRLARGQVLR